MSRESIPPRVMRPAHWPAHWVWIDLPENNGDPRLVDAVNSLMDVYARPPGADFSAPEFPVLDADPSLADLPRDHTEGTSDNSITLVGVVRLAKAVLAVADQHAAQLAWSAGRLSMAPEIPDSSD